uniref:ATP-dependent RNA helicase n=1 Tax=Gasterosteus aculeatus aculeatus TaxID=481459 RepID=A0AAQ4S1X1_GASAC
MEKKGGTKPKTGKKMIDGTDPVRNFEKWKKKYNKTRMDVKRDRSARKKPQWQVEREYIDKLVSRYGEINAKEVVRFSDFPISKKTLQGLQGVQCRQPTEIQRQTIGSALQGKDVLGAAKTGSGKTLAFLIPVLECLYRHQWTSMDGLGALIISPTRELAYQTFEVLRKVGKNHEFSAGLIIGGKDLKSESEQIHRTNIVICTPGRLLQHMDQTATFHASDLHMLVLDEADRILDMGFMDTVNAIVENLPASRQTLLFSATQTKSVKDLARLSLKDPEYVWVHEKAKFSTPATLEQSYVVCQLHQKVNMLYSFIKSHPKKKIIVFFACCKEEGMVSQLQEKKVPINKIQVNPDKLQNVQLKLEAFLAQEKEQKERAQRCFVSYLRSVYLMKNKEVFDVFKLQIQEYANSLGLAVAPRVRFLIKAQAQRDEKEDRKEVKELSDGEEELRSFKAQLRGGVPQEERQSSESQDSGENEESVKGEVLHLGSDDESEDDLKDLDLLTVKRKDVFNPEGDAEIPADLETVSLKKTMKNTKFTEAKKALKRKFQVNTKVAFSEEGQAVQMWPPVQRATTQEGEEEEEEEGVSGINMEKARERLKLEDQQFDKQEYRRKVKAKHTEQRLKAKAARRDANKQHGRNSEEEEDEIVAYLAHHSEDEFDPSTLPDPDKMYSDEEEEMVTAKQHSSEEEEEELKVGKGKKAKKAKRQTVEHEVLDTGLSLAEDEQLVLHLLGGHR